MLLKGEVREIKEAQPFKNELLLKSFEKFPARRFLFWVADLISSCSGCSFILFVLLNVWILSRDISYFAMFNHLLNFNASDSIKKWVLQRVFSLPVKEECLHRFQVTFKQTDTMWQNRYNKSKSGTCRKVKLITILGSSEASGLQLY